MNNENNHNNNIKGGGEGKKDNKESALICQEESRVMSAVCASLWSDFGRCEQDSAETVEREDAAAVREEVICQNFHWEFS